MSIVNPVSKVASSAIALRKSLQPLRELDDYRITEEEFLEQARFASQRVLYFTDLVKKTGRSTYDDRIEKIHSFALAQIKTLINQVQLPDIQSPTRQFWFTKFGIEDQDDFARYWRDSIADWINEQPAFDSATASELIDRIETFCTKTQIRFGVSKPGFFNRASRKLSDIPRVFYSDVLPRVSQLFKLHAAYFSAMVIGGAILFGVDIFRNLIFNDLRDSLVAAVLVTLPWIILRVWAWDQRRQSAKRGDPTVPFWDYGSRAFHTFFVPAAVTPERWIRRWPADASVSGLLLRAVATKTALYFVLTAAFAGAYLIRAGITNNDTHRTVAVLFVLYSCALILGHAIDFWDHHDSRPIRGSIGTAVVMVIGLVISRDLGPMLPVAVAFVLLTMTATTFVRTKAIWWLPCTLVLIPIFLLQVAATKSDLNDRWGAGVKSFNRLQPGEWPRGGAEGPPIVIVAASGGGSRAAVYTALTLHRIRAQHPTIATQIQLISSVSGGSLANAAYTARLYDGDQASVLRGDIIDAAASDFIWPTILGALSPTKNRAGVLQRTWNDGAIKLESLSMADLAETWRKSPGDSAPFPIPIFNTTSLDRHDVIISPLSKSFYVDSAQERRGRAMFAPASLKEKAFRAWVDERDGIYPLEDLAPNFNPSLAAAVRASASFPFGFPLVRVNTNKELYYSPRIEDRGTSRKTILLTDGGALSNSGLWPLFNLLKNNRDLLLKRGVVLVVVDVSRMPAAPVRRGETKNLIMTVMDGAPVAQALHRRMYEQLLDTYSLNGVDTRLSIIEVTLPSISEYNVHTTWALDDVSLAKLDRAFRLSWDNISTRLTSDFNALSIGESVPKHFPARVPFD